MLSYCQELSTGIQCQIPIGQPPTGIDELNQKMTRCENPRARPRMPGPPNMEHPYNNPFKKTFFCLPKRNVLPNVHRGGMGWAPSQLPAYPAVKIQKGNKKTLFWKIGDVVTVASAVSQPNGHDPEMGSTPSSRIDADNCDDAPS